MKPSKETAKKAIAELIGKGKVLIIENPIQQDGHWRIQIEENGNRKFLHFRDYNEAQEVCLEFGGNNVLTIAAPMKLNDFENWSYDELFKMGHYVKSISLMQSTFNNDMDRRIPYELPSNYGTSLLPGGRKKEQNAVFHEIIKTENYVLPRTVCFEKPTQLDDFKEWLYAKFPGHSFMVDSFVSQNHETNDFCKFLRKKVGDSTKRMELKLVKLNGEDYQRCRIKSIMAAADGLTAHECKVVTMEKPSRAKEDHCGFYLGV